MMLPRVTFCLSILIAGSGAAQTQVHILDINKQSVPISLSSEPKRADRNHYKRAREFVRLGSRAIFQGYSPMTGREVFTVSAKGSSVDLLLDIEPGPKHSNPTEFVLAGSRVYFSAYQAATGAELWVTDGTAKGTMLIADLAPKTQSSNPAHLCALGTTGKIVFRATTAATGQELFISDGTIKGTTLLKDIGTGASSSYPSYMTGFHDGKKDLVVFQAYSTSTGNELWVTDGTTAGTRLLKDIVTGTNNSRARDFQVLGNKVLFTADTSMTGRELWVTDGTTAGTLMLKDIRSGAVSGTYLIGGVVLAGKYYFEGTTSQAGSEPWVTDGTSAGTKLIVDANPGTASGYFRHPATLGGKILYAGNNTVAGGELRVLDPTTGKVGLLADLNVGTSGSNPTELTTVGKMVVFQAYTIPTGREVFVSDGTKAGTRLLMDTVPGRFDRRITSLTTLSSSKLVFAGQFAGYTGIAITDGTSLGTRLLPVVIPGIPTASSNPKHAVPFHGGMIFSADDGRNGRELWTSDGTSLGTRMVVDLFPGSDRNEKPNASAPSGMTVLGDMVLFAADDGKGKGRELWISDGTKAGTRLLADIYDGPSDSNPDFLERIGSHVVFAASGYDTANPRNYVGQELFITDGTRAGTKLLADLTPGILGSYSRGFTEIGTSGRFVFSARAYTSSAPHQYLGQELWISDGTSAGTHVLVDLIPGSGSGNPKDFVAFGDKVCFMGSSSTSKGLAIFITDGTRSGTKVFADLASAGLTYPDHLVAQRGKVYFQARVSGKGSELCVSDGTKAGTKMLQDVYSGYSSSRPSSLSAVGSRHVLFQARGWKSGPAQGYELWKLDSLTGIAKLHADIAPGRSNANPTGFSRRGQSPFAVSRGKVWFSAWTFASGVELMFVENGAIAQAQGQSCQSSLLTSTDPVLGRTASIAGRTRSGFLGNVLLLGTASPAPIGMTGPCMLYLSPFGPMITLQVSTGNTYGLQVKIPAATSFSGMQLLLQSIHLGSTFPSTSGFSNAVEWTLGN